MMASIFCNGKKIVPYGSWKSPITAALIAAANVRVGDICIDDKKVYWVESRPSEGGRNTIMELSETGEIRDCLPYPYDVRSKVNEYGGGAMTVHAGIFYFVHARDQQVYQMLPGNSPTPLTDDTNMRYADLKFDHRRNRLIAVQEDRTNASEEPRHSLVVVDLMKGGAISSLMEGDDFYAFPCLSPDGDQFAWISWQHPNMPWDASELWMAAFQNDGQLGEVVCIVDGRQESVFQPQWSPDNQLYFVSDRAGWWNLYRYEDDSIVPLYQVDAEFGLPQWVFNMSTYGFQSAEQLICACTRDGSWQLGAFDTRKKIFTAFELPYTYLEQIRVTPNRAYFFGATPTRSRTLVEMDLISGKKEERHGTGRLQVADEYLSVPRHITFPTGQDQAAHAFFYPPQNRNYCAAPDELPPLIVIGHSGPTGSAEKYLNTKIQFWSSRGFAVLEVNYRGSTGFGRAYRQELDGLWGIADVEDCVNGAKYLVRKKWVDKTRLIIRGSSAGGFTALAAMTFHDIFQAGASYYGISDLEIMVKETHKFESCYSERLIGAYPEEREKYQERSPIHFGERLSRPIIFFQGLKDEVVLPGQSEKMVHILKTKGIPVAYITLPEEGHGFRRPENIKRTLEDELCFYAKIFNFIPGDSLKNIDIENFSETSG